MTVTVASGYGKIAGNEEGGVLSFKGIPFAAPPVGDRRWRAPQQPQPWSDTLQADAFSACAMQNPLPSQIGELIGIATGEIAEDCLYLNVWTPAVDAPSRPVMVWIHGGGNTVGSASQPRFNGAHLALAGDVVIVTINYRLGAFGFLHLPALGASGNEALLDQVAALRWVRQEIHRFGGDAGNVTVFGQSAGGFDIAELMSLPAAAGCFDKAIPMSGSITNQVSREEAQRTAQYFLDEFGSVDALLDVAADTILNFQQKLMADRAADGVRFGPVRDGVIIAEDAATGIGDGTYCEGIPLLIGTTQNEATLFTTFNESYRNLDDAALAKRVTGMLGDRAGEAISCYRQMLDPDLLGVDSVDLMAAMSTDRMFRIPAIRTAELHSRHTPQTWMYLFDYTSPAEEGKLKACHSLDIPFIFGTCSSDSMRPFCGDGSEVDTLSRAMMATYIAFARDGDPSNALLPEWPTYDVGRRATMRLGLDCRIEEAPLDAVRALWL
jgi:para-nitrobenzyl esterase|tara:strand:+ start:5448 stop:6932 length:1485 start_codon:yes stop_codon:yes gene_type:complete